MVRVRVKPSSTNVMLPPFHQDVRCSRVPSWLTRVVLPCAGTLYLAGTVGTSLAYLTVLVEYVANDFWWREFNTTGGQTYVADVFNAKLILGRSDRQSVDLLDASAAMLYDYSATNTFVHIRPVAARRWLLDALPLDVAVTTIRKNSLYENVFTIVPHCWVDFDRRFDMAHTVKRQQRCKQRQGTNAAVYLESLLRNVDASDLLLSSFGQTLYATILTPLGNMTGGAAWVQTLPVTWPSVADEVQWWSRHSVTHWTIPMQNRFQIGFEDTISIVNALGVSQPITISSWPYLYRGLAAWSSCYSSVGLWNDLNMCTFYGCTLVANSNSSLVNMGMDWDLEYNGPASTVGMRLIRSRIGPLMAVDFNYVHAPASLVAVFEAFQRQFLIMLMQVAVEVGDQPVIDVVPTSWQDPTLSFYGGSPLCLSFTEPQSYPQMPLAFNDGCQTQDPFAVEFNRPNLVLAMLVLGFHTPDEVDAVCKLSVNSVQACHAALTSALTLLRPVVADFNMADVPRAVQDIVALHIQFMQLVVRNTSSRTSVLLTQDLLSSTDSAWSFIGWIALYDWVDGTREVYNVEGDQGEMTLMTGMAPYVHFVANAQELPRKACVYLWYLAVYVSTMSAAVAVAMALVGVVAKLQVDGATNLFAYNRIGGSVWIGRPLMFIRGMTAVIVLSTATPTLHVVNYVTSFVQPARPLVETLLLASETVWLQYVLNDALLPVTQPHSKEYAILGSVVGFFMVVYMELTAPYVAQTTIHRSCAIASFRRGIKCTSGEIAIGSFDRVCAVIEIHVGCAVCAYVVVRLARHILLASKPAKTSHHALIPAATEAYCSPEATDPTAWHLDAMTCIMSGMVPLRKSLFDFKTWAVVPGHRTTGHTFAVPTLVVPCPTTSSTSRSPSFRTRHAWLGGLSLLYMTTSIAGSYTFLELTKSAMTNDFWWASFDAQTHVYVCNWFNTMLQVTASSTANVQIHSAGHGALASTTNLTASVVGVSPLYAIAVQDDANSLSNVILGLRNMDGCLVPWIMTSYCYADFGRRWEMAPSVAKQDRCLVEDVQNGAVYLDSMLRNADLASLSRCWGDALDIGVFSHVRTSVDGLAWLESVRMAASMTPVEEEERVWRRYGIATYTTQWQNFKALGVIESFSILNAFGWSYPITLKVSNGTFQLPVQTSFKMAWPLAWDLSLIVANASVLSHKSLLRRSSNFAYANMSLDMMSSEFVPRPMGPGMAMVESALGPFGSVKMKREACPSSLRSLYQQITGQLKQRLGTDAAIQTAFWPIYYSFTMQPVMNVWASMSERGGDILCEMDPNFQPVDDRAAVSFSYRGLCGVRLQDTLTGDTGGLIKAIVATSDLNATAAAALERYSPDTSMRLIASAQAFTTAAFSIQELTTLQQLAQSVRLEFRQAILNLTMVQFIVRRASGGPPPADAAKLSTVNVFDESEQNFELFAWLYLFDWVQGIREVVTFQGDVGAITSMSTTTVYTEMPVNPMEVPLNVAFYMRWLLQYITFVMLGVAVVVCVYIVALKGQVEAANMTSFSRITSLVWIGRPLILLRAFCAICLLSTSSLTLTRPLDGLVSFLKCDSKPWYMVILTAGELNWMTYIINDVCSVFTHQYTQKYSWTSFVVVWAASAVWEFAAPVAYSVVVDRVCRVDQVDFEVVCRGGTVEIGSVRRFTTLIGLVFGYCAGSFAFVRWWFPHMTATSKTSSVFLYTCAKHQFVAAKWELDGTQYLDKASAVLTGLLSVQFRHVLYLFDIKTWRVYTIPLATLDTMDRNLPPHLAAALPLIEDD
ncbi:hypothetical protein DYB30_001979 [Aphanomyces astaci]|uniref:Transmembrane protein n=1 Tax=Aphanomyces astaci TaxID=112090 RepID=A0A397DGH1_APHAT|nr:hypothetical protein DYB30_001979 [Aphanomyces astaci]